MQIKSQEGHLIMPQLAKMPPKWNESISYCKSVENWCYSDFHVILLGSIFLLSASFSYFLVVFAVYNVRPHLIIFALMYSATSQHR